jgi:hypothetical protein
MPEMISMSVKEEVVVVQIFFPPKLNTSYSVIATILCMKMLATQL